MKTLHIIVANKIATYSHRGGDIVCGNSDYQIEFNFDTEWDAYETKTARFIWNGKYKDVVFTGTVCPVPIVANTDKLEIGVYSEELSTTTSAIINCKRSILCNSDVKSEGTVIVPEGNPVLGETIITENGEHYPEDGYDGFYKVTVKVVAEPEEVRLQEKTATENGIVTADSGYDGLSKVTVNIASEVPNLSGIEITPTKDYQNIVPEGDCDGFDEVIVNPIPSEYIIPSGTKEITANGTYDVKDKASVEVAIPKEIWDGTGVVIAPIPQPKTFTINGTSYQMDNRMTWYAWTRSDYNTDGFACAEENDYVYEAESKNKVTDVDGNDVLGTNYIVEGGAYLIQEAVTEDELGTFTYAQTSSWYSQPIVRQFPLGTTWGEFIESDYNAVKTDTGENASFGVKGQFINQNGYVMFSGTDLDGSNPLTISVYNSSFASVLISSEIVNGGIYKSTSSSGGGGSN